MRQLTDSEMAHLAAGWRRYKSEYETEPTHIWPFEHGFTGGLDTAAERIAALETQLRAESAELDGLRAALAEIAAGNPAPPGGKWLSAEKMAQIARRVLGGS